jgi:retron-type reverse transcriptase
MLSVRLIKKLEGIEGHQCTKEVESRVRLTPPARFGGRRTHAPQRCDGAYPTKPNSYGFRPGRSCHDAIEAIFMAIRYKPKYVLDADIEKCFDRIEHQELLRKVKTVPQIRRQLKAWLQAGVIDQGQWFRTESGTIQGSPLSPLLANIAIHGIEEAVAKKYTRNPRRGFYLPIIVRYADDRARRKPLF